MIFNILSVFNQLIKPSLKYGILGKAIKSKKIKVNLFEYSNFLSTTDRIDDKQFGEDPGMVIKYDVANKALNSIKKLNPKTKVIFLSPKGKKLDYKLVDEFSKLKNITIVSGRYEGFDERIIEEHADLEISIGDFVLSGGEIPSIVLIDAISTSSGSSLPREISSED